MNNKLLLLLLIVILSFASCYKDSPPSVNFNVTTPDSVYGINDTVVFSINGNPDDISFYSGDSGNNYALRNQTTKSGGSVNFSFQIRASNDSVFSAIANGSFKVLVSNNFPGTYSTLTNDTAANSADSVLVNDDATWTDVTSRFAIPASSANWPLNTYYLTPSVNIGDVITNPSNPLNIAFKYSADTTHYMGSNGISIGSLLLNSKFPDGTSTSFNVVPGGSKSTTWYLTNATTSPYPWVTSSTQIKVIPKYGTTYTEDWAISNAFFPDAAQPDIAIPIKNIAQSQLTSFAYKFQQKGLHKVFFVASNNRVGGTSQTVREIDLDITQ